FENKLREHGGNVTRAAVELAKDWRGDRVLRRLEAMMIVADKERTLVVSGTGDVIEPDEGAGAIGSGGGHALAAARALLGLAKLVQAPFLKVEASKFTEVGYVGRDVDSIVRDLVEISVKLVKDEEREKVKARAREHAEERLLDLLLPPPPPRAPGVQPQIAP